MFGYVMPNLSAFSENQESRFRSAYCGLCHVLYQRYGNLGTSTLSYDLTFLAILLNGLYEEEEKSTEERCFIHPIKKHKLFYSRAFEYAADMNIALAYHKCLDNWLDDHSVISRGEARLLERSYRKISDRYPEKCRAIEQWLGEIHDIEGRGIEQIDPPANSTGKMLGELFCYQDDFWADSLRAIGSGLGRFIYLMDAYDDLEEDIQKKRYNPLKSYRERPDFETLCMDALRMMVADSTQEFESLPILRDADLLRNVLYSGIWNRYIQIQHKKEAKSKGA